MTENWQHEADSVEFVRGSSDCDHGPKIQQRGRQICLTTCNSLEAQSLALVIPIDWQLVKPLEMLGGQFERLPTRQNGLDNIRREECEGKQSADLVGGNVLLVGDIIDGRCIAGRQLCEPGMGPGDSGDQKGINEIVVLAVAHNQPCLDTTPPHSPNA